MRQFNSNTLRSEQGEGYYTVINDDIIIPWKPLSIGDFIKYEILFQEGSVIQSVLEDEIFHKCVTDNNYIKDINFLPAGIISIVVQNIFEYSGPPSTDVFNNYLDINRELASTSFHSMVPIIVRAFPAYKLEEIYEMPYEIFMLRLAQAESLLLRFGVIKDPLYLKDPNEQPKKKQSKISTEDMRNIKARWENEKQNLDVERIGLERAAGTEDESAERARMIKEAALIYKDKLSKVPKKEG